MLLKCFLGVILTPKYENYTNKNNWITGRTRLLHGLVIESTVFCIIKILNKSNGFNFMHINYLLYFYS